MHYRLYAVHPITGAITAGDDLAATDDHEAIAKGHQVHGGKCFELWCGTRRVHIHDSARPPR